MWRMSGVESLSVNSGCFMLVGAIQCPLPDDIIIAGSGGNCYLARVHTIFVNVIVVL